MTTSAPRDITTEAALMLRSIGPGVALAALIAVVALLLAHVAEPFLVVPPILAALLIGMALHPLAMRTIFGRGLTFCVKTLLRWAVALLGLRISLGEIVLLGATTAATVIGAMLITLGVAIALAPLLGLTRPFSALAGAGTAVCGASATLATATVLPDYPEKDRDVIYVVLLVNALSTVAMLAYPPLCAWLHLDAQQAGVLLGGTIHDVAQVVGAGFSVSPEVGDTSVIVKLFRVFLLLPVVLAIGYWLGRRPAHPDKARPRVSAARVATPGFALAFLALCLLNSTVDWLPSLAPGYVVLKGWLLLVSQWGLLVAIAALGLGTSFAALRGIGWRQFAMLTATSLAILGAVLTQLMWLR